MKHGYTLVELMIIVVIVGILVGFGVSAYGKARDRQAGMAAVEQVLSLLQANQTKANIGDADCSGAYAGQQVTVESAGIIRSRSVCAGGDLGVETATTISGLTSLSPTGVIVFNPLSLGMTLPSSPFTLTLTSLTGITYQITMTGSGVIEYDGITP